MGPQDTGHNDRRANEKSVIKGSAAPLTRSLIGYFSDHLSNAGKVDNGKNDVRRRLLALVERPLAKVDRDAHQQVNQRHPY
jgi:hypothetical protein